MKVMKMLYTQKKFVQGKWAVLVPKMAHISESTLGFFYKNFAD